MVIWLPTEVRLRFQLLKILVWIRFCWCQCFIVFINNSGCCCAIFILCVFLSCMNTSFAMLIRPNLKQNQNDKHIINQYAFWIVQLTRVPKNDWFKSLVQMKRKSCELMRFYFKKKSFRVFFFSKSNLFARFQFDKVEFDFICQPR